MTQYVVTLVPGEDGFIVEQSTDNVIFALISRSVPTLRLMPIPD